MLYHTVPKHINPSLDVSLSYATLNDMLLADIIDICREQRLPTEGTKSQLISDLLFWREHSTILPAPSSPRLSFDGEDRVSGKVVLSFVDDEDDSNLVIPFEEIQVKEKIGSGGFKDCYKGIYKGESVAVGELRWTRTQEINFAEIKHEINVLKQLRHENVIRLIGVCSHPSHFYIVTELCSKGDLFDFIRRYPKPSFTQQVLYMYDIALGVSYLHTRRPSIIHRDLKSMNILISHQDRAKINDFGLARIRPKASTLMHTQCGTPNWQAPEFWTANPSYTEKVDVYASALIFWEILTWGSAGYPYQALGEHELYEAVKQRHVRPQLPLQYPSSLLLFIKTMWEADPNARPSMNHVIERLSTYLA